MNDKELLELAVMAASIEVRPHPNRNVSKNLIFIGSKGNWNPLTDDGDALRLAVKLRIGVMHSSRHVACDLPHDDYAFEEGVTDGHTRRAIVRAAAEIGRRM